MAIFTTRGYQTTDLGGSRAAARGVLEIPAFAATYDLPYLGWGTISHPSHRGFLEFFNGAWCSGARLFNVTQLDRPDVSPTINSAGLPYLGFGLAPNSIQRGPFYPPQNSWRTIARGKLWLGIGPIVKKFPSRMVLGAPPFPDHLVGRVAWRRQRPEDYVPNALGVVLPRIAAAIPPHPEYLTGRIGRRLGHSPDILPLPFLVFSPRVVAPIPPHPDHTLGRIRRRSHHPKDYVPNPRFVTAIRRATPVPPWPDRLNGKTSRFQPHNVTVLFAREMALLQSLSARCGRDMSLLQPVRARNGATLAQAQALDAFTRAGYRLFALNLETGEENDLGFIAADGPLAIADVSLADGHYEIRLRASSHWWQHARFESVFPITIEGGETIDPLPAILNLAYAIDGETVYLSWSWELTAGFQTPDDFAIWIAPSEPVDTSGAPSYVIPANAPGAVTTTISGGTAGEFVAVCSRRDDTKGPVSTIHIESADAAIASPENQRVRYLFS